MREANLLSFDRSIMSEAAVLIPTELFAYQKKNNILTKSIKTKSQLLYKTYHDLISP